VLEYTGNIRNFVKNIVMTKQEYIDYWVNTAAEDWITVEALFDIKRYMHCLFWSHLVLEKLAKAHWVKTHEDNIPPKVHNIVWLLEESGVDLGEETMMFLTKFNRFQLSARYPDYLNKISSACTESYTVQQLEEIKEVRQCLLEKL
jgi:HEPN domain-containing protein